MTKSDPLKTTEPCGSAVELISTLLNQSEPKSVIRYHVTSVDQESCSMVFFTLVQESAERGLVNCVVVIHCDTAVLIETRNDTP